MTRCWARPRWARTDRPRAHTSGPRRSWSPPPPEAAGSAGRWGSTPCQWLARNDFAAIQFNAVVSTNTAAIALWQSLGFETIGTVPTAFRLPGDSATASYADLHVMYLSLAAS